MTTKKTIKQAIDATSNAPLKRASVEDGEKRAVLDTNASGAADSVADVPGGPRIESKAAADLSSAPVPNVQAEDNPASVAPEDVRKASVAEPNT